MVSTDAQRLESDCFGWFGLSMFACIFSHFFFLTWLLLHCKYHILPNYRTVLSGFSKLLGKFVEKYVSTYTKGTLEKRSAKDLSNNAYAMFFLFFFSDFLYNGVWCGYLFELHQPCWCSSNGYQDICLYTEDKKYTGCNLKTVEWFDCVLIGVCTVIRLNTVFTHLKSSPYLSLHLNKTAVFGHLNTWP